MATIYLAEITVYDPALGHTSVMRYASNAGYNHPSAPGFYEGRMLQPMHFSRSMFAEGKTSGASQLGTGEMILANNDGGLDGWRDLGVDGQSFRLLAGDDQAAYGTFVLVFAGTMDQPLFQTNGSELSLVLRDKLSLLSVPLQPTKFAGTNALPAGVEGTPNDIAGQPKPVVYGSPTNVAPPCCNTALLVYQVADGALGSVDAVYDSGAALPLGHVQASLAALMATAPAAGTYDCFIGGPSYIRLGSAPAGQVTCDLSEGANAAARTVGQIVSRVVQARGGLVAGDLNAGDFAALDALNSAVIGFWSVQEMTVAQVLDAVAASGGCWYGFDNNGKFRLGRLDAPAGVPVATLTRLDSRTVAGANMFDMVDFDNAAPNDSGRGVPTWLVSLDYAPNWTVQTSGLVASVAAGRRAYLATANRTVISSDATVKTVHPLAQQTSVATLFNLAVAAQAEADRLRVLLSPRRDYLTVTVKFTIAVALAFDLGRIVSIRFPRFGYTAGRLMAVIGLEYDLQAGTLKLGLWG